MIPLIIFAGRAGSGKDTACEELAKLLDGPLGVVAQADPMKRYIRAVFPGLFSEENLWGPTAAREEPRRTDHDDNCRRAGFHRETLALCKEIGLPYTGEIEGPAALFRRWFDDCDGRATSPTGLTVRHAAQQLGTEVVRRIDPDAWWKRAVGVSFELLVGRAEYGRTTGVIATSTVPRHAAAVPDGRFPNEILGVREAGGLAVKLIGRASGLVGNAAHASETSLDGIPDHFYDFVVDNSGSIDDLREQLKQVVEWMHPCQTMSAERMRRRMG